MKKTFVDALGKEYKKGDYVVFPSTRSSSLWVNLVLVTEVTPDRLKAVRASQDWMTKKWKITKVGQFSTGRGVIVEDPGNTREAEELKKERSAVLTGVRIVTS